MKNWLIVFILFMLPMLAHAEIDERGLTEKQKAELALKAAEMKQGNNPVAALTSAPTTATASEWIGVGKEIGAAINAGLMSTVEAADKFSKTNVGLVTVGLIVWKILGHDILTAIAGIILLIVATYFMRRATRNIYEEGASYEYKPYLWGAWQRQVVTRKRELDSDAGMGLFLTYAAYLVMLVISIMLIA